MHFLTDTWFSSCYANISSRFKLYLHLPSICFFYKSLFYLHYFNRFFLIFPIICWLYLCYIFPSKKDLVGLFFLECFFCVCGLTSIHLIQNWITQLNLHHNLQQQWPPYLFRRLSVQDHTQGKDDQFSFLGKASTCLMKNHIAGPTVVKHYRGNVCMYVHMYVCGEP